MIVTPEDKLLFEALGIVAELHKRNEQRNDRLHLNLDRLPDEIRKLLLSLCTTNSPLIGFDIKQISRRGVTTNTGNGIVFVPYNDQFFVYGLTDAGWEKYRELEQRLYSRQQKPKIPTITPVPVVPPYHNAEVDNVPSKNVTVHDLEKDISFDIKTQEFEIAFSFPGEHRGYVKDVVDILICSYHIVPEKIFYDDFYRDSGKKTNHRNCPTYQNLLEFLESLVI